MWRNYLSQSGFDGSCSKALRRASMTNNMEHIILEKQKIRLHRKFRAQELKSEAAQKRLRFRRYSYEEDRKKSSELSLRPNQIESLKDSTVLQPVKKIKVGSLPPIQDFAEKTGAEQLGEQLQVQTTNETLVSPKSNTEDEELKTGAQNSLLPSVKRDLWGVARSLYFSSAPGRKTSISTLVQHQKQEKFLSRNQLQENSYKTGTRHKFVDFSSVGLRARIKFVAHMNVVLRRSRETSEKDIAEGAPSKDRSDIQREYEALENCRYLRIPYRNRITPRINWILLTKVVKGR